MGFRRKKKLRRGKSRPLFPFGLAHMVPRGRMDRLATIQILCPGLALTKLTFCKWIGARSSDTSRNSWDNSTDNMSHTDWPARFFWVVDMQLSSAPHLHWIFGWFTEKD
ncbi:hypothetical protein GUJ93_ZPchr0013g37692 [Zizania palustris]|nr:hypothetical protein GUJ93_ZPchr0013g37692 [Zizania palustris]